MSSMDGAGEAGTVNIPDEVLAEADMLNGDSTLGAYEVIAKWARREALREAIEAVAGVFPYNWELNPADLVMAAWVEGGHDAWAAIRAIDLREGAE